MPYKDPKMNTNAVVRWRQNARRKLVAGYGNECGSCGYNRCVSALEMRHINTKEKDFSFGGSQSIAWAKLVKEAKKCVLLCSNCHREVHAGFLTVMPGMRRFDETLAV